MVVIVVVEASYLVSGRVMDVVIEEVIVIEEVVVDMKEAMISISDIAKNIDLVSNWKLHLAVVKDLQW